MAGFRDKIANKYYQDIYYVEDDVRFTSHPLDCLDKDSDIVWSVYRSGNWQRNGKVLWGTQAIWFSKETLYKLRYNMRNLQLVHFDSYLSKFIHQEIKQPDFKATQVIPKIGYEEEHNSLISTDKGSWERFTQPNLIV